MTIDSNSTSSQWKLPGKTEGSHVSTHLVVNSQKPQSILITFDDGPDNSFVDCVITAIIPKPPEGIELKPDTTIGSLAGNFVTRIHLGSSALLGGNSIEIVNPNSSAVSGTFLINPK